MSQNRQAFNHSERQGDKADREQREEGKILLPSSLFPDPSFTDYPPFIFHLP
jgi:hypothetical protein